MNNRFFRGSRFQKGFGLGGVCVHRRKGSFQKGSGIGGIWSKFVKWISPIFSKVKNFALPIIKESGKEIGKEAVSAASDIANAVLDGKDLKESASDRVEAGVDKLIEKASKKMEGRGFEKKRKIFGSFSKQKKKPRMLDIFDN